LDAARRRALENRYDGPIPVGAAVAPNFHLPWHDQLSNRKRWAWMEVRRIGHLMVQARAAGGAPRDGNPDRERTRLRANLAFALRNWAAYRDWSRTG
jgi:hypothetical protein